MFQKKSDHSSPSARNIKTLLHNCLACSADILVWSAASTENLNASQYPSKINGMPIQALLNT